MSLSPVVVVPFTFLLLAQPVLAQPRSEADRSPLRRLELPAPSGGDEVRAAPGWPTTLLFNAALDQDAVERAARELGFARVAVAEDTLTVVPGAEVKAGTRLRLPVRFAQGQPEEVAVVFVVDPQNAEASVEVVRRPRTVAALEEALSAERARCKALEAALAAKDVELAVAHAQAGSLVALVVAGTLGREGIRSVEQEVKAPGWAMPKGINVEKAQLYMATGRMALDVELTLEGGAPAWAPQSATLVMSTGPVIPARVKRLLGAAVLAPGEKARLVVEFAVPTGDPSLTYTLEVTAQDPQREKLRGDLTLAAPAARKR
ncbi:DUF2381 family protein [Hyalangium versicolor]|uniref:DUF2381 family protein n=1 Tax=Hyalangium versicolor TaxID=2861190 RepID=UPI001CCAA187|nr:DUF2381 family protein [Hyalangium versicolor]